ncbi:MAG: nucleotidyltransferase [Pseudozobellia sp.]|nr:nucleotidyltransferase [Pseudozobellia sp.]MBG50562.1 nucleotidyltransferase [Pseudozobellia sp.]|tara:strand:+ start:23265 stop:25190 length:1926 start_codon:yes stop_codon:yes gene_type:complete
MKNTISVRVADFLKNYPPFNELRSKDLEVLSQEIKIIYKVKDAIIFSEDEKAHEHFYVVHKGAVALLKKPNESMVDLCDEGDIFGLRPLMANEDYKMEAKAYEESILYAIPIANFRPFTKSHDGVANFLMESFASNTRNPYSIGRKGKLFQDGPEANDAPKEGSDFLDLQSVNYSKKLVTCTPNTTLKTVALSMTKKKVGAMLILKNKLPIGIITDKDIRNKIATGEFPITAKAKDIMSSPVITYPKKMTLAQAQMAMMKSGISHLCITSDGTPNSEAIGIISKHDIMLELGNNPAVLMKAIKRAGKYKKIKTVRRGIMSLLQGYLRQNIPLTLISKIITELNDACIKQVISIALEKMEEQPPVKFAWLALGSQGRSEQLLHTDQDNALIFEDVPSEDLQVTKEYFLLLSKQVTQGLNAIGYEYCPADMMASNPEWCLSISEWKERTLHWITNPGRDEVLLSSIFFDFNRSYGESFLVDELTEHIFETTQKYPIFFVHLASGALQNPSPSGFFRSFLVEEDGAHKDFFDLKRRALIPLVDGARVLVLSSQIKSINNTAERFEKLAELEPNNQELFLACSYATKALLKFRTRQGLLHNDSGRFIALDTLSKEEKIKLKRTFKTIKELQELIKIRFKVANLVG